MSQPFVLSTRGWGTAAIVQGPAQRAPEAGRGPHLLTPPLCTCCIEDHRWLMTLPSFLSLRHSEEWAPAVRAPKA